ncbi:MAG: hypothetical protein WC575_03040 [Patescibacteria group bacterium]
MKKQTLILVVIVIFSSFLLLTISQKQKQPITNTSNLNTNNQPSVIDKYSCQTETDCALTGSDPDGFATCANNKWYEKWLNNPLSKNHVWECEFSEEEKCGCVNNKCQRMDNSKSCGDEFSPLPDRVSLKMAKGLFTQEENIVAEVYNTLDREIGFDPSELNPFTTLEFEKFNNQTGEFEIYTEIYCNAPTDIPPDYDLTRNWPVILKPNELYKLIWAQGVNKSCMSDSTLEKGHYRIILKFCYPKTNQCFNTYSNEFSVAGGDYYYYSDNRRIYLDKADNWFVIQIAAKDQQTKLEQFLRDSSPIRLKQVLNEERGFFWMEFSANIEREYALQELQQYVNIVRLIPAFLRTNPRGEITKFIMTDEFHVKFHPNVTKNEVEEMNKNYDVEILSVSKYNEYLLRVTESSKYTTLELANIYYDSELTVWSLPNFLSDIRLE